MSQGRRLSVRRALGIYIPRKPDTPLHRQGHTNTCGFVADLLRNVAGPKPVGSNLAPQVEVTLSSAIAQLDARARAG